MNFGGDKGILLYFNHMKEKCKRKICNGSKNIVFQKEEKQKIRFETGYRFRYNIFKVSVLQKRESVKQNQAKCLKIFGTYQIEGKRNEHKRRMQKLAVLPDGGFYERRIQSIFGKDY